MPQKRQNSEDHAGSDSSSVQVGSNNGIVITGGVKGNVTLNAARQDDAAGIDMDKLKAELAVLLQALKEQALSDDENIAIGEVAKAAKAAKLNETDKVLAHLKAAGQWVLDIAIQIGVPVAAAALRKALGL